MDSYLDETDDVIRVKEVGPIVYSYNHNITIMDWLDQENVIKFAKFRTYYYEPEMSKISLNASINAVNILAATILDNVHQYGTLTKFFAESKVHTNFKRHGTTLFFTKTVDELLFAGYDASVLMAIKPEASVKYPDGLYGLMHGVFRYFFNLKLFKKFLILSFLFSISKNELIHRKITLMMVFGKSIQVKMTYLS